MPKPDVEKRQVLAHQMEEGELAEDDRSGARNLLGHKFKRAKRRGTEEGPEEELDASGYMQWLLDTWTALGKHGKSPYKNLRLLPNGKTLVYGDKKPEKP
jgi:hypothetical protein